ncbi:MAG: YfiR family protein [Steroidobacteraceae bacterium]
MRNAWLSVLLGACWVAWSGLQTGLAQTADSLPVTERSIKAAYLYKFAGYVEWPDVRSDSAKHLTIGVLESSEMAEELVRITAGRLINDRPVRIRQVTGGDSLAGVHVLFVGTHDRERLDELLLPALELPILTVTESAGALSDGSIINFTIDRERVRFEVSLPAAERSRLKLSSRLLAVAQRVQRTPES